MENLIGKDTITNVVLVGIFLPEDDERGFEASLDELERLTETAGGKVFVVNGSPTDLDAEAAFCGKDLAVFAEAILRSFPSEGPHGDCPRCPALK